MSLVAQAKPLRLEEIEVMLSNLLHQDRANWTEMARLAILVQQQKLYTERGFRSFTQWVKETARANDRQPSLIWLNLKAARYFLKLRQLNIDDGAALEQITKAKAAPEALATLEKIERQAPTPVFEALKQRVLAGEARVHECRQIERDYRTAEGRTNRGRPPKGHEGRSEYFGVWKHKPESEEQGIFGAGEGGTTPQTIDVDAVAVTPEPIIFTRSQIASAIRRSLSVTSDWPQSAAQMRYPPKFWSTHAEVRLSTGHGRLRLDLVSVIRWSLKRPKDLFGVEIKSCLTDFEADEKWLRYLDFCHYFCFAIPLQDQELLTTVENRSPKSVGILGIDLSSPPRPSDLSYPVQVIRKPQKQEATVEKTSLLYETLYERVLGWSGTDTD